MFDTTELKMRWIGVLSAEWFCGRAVDGRLEVVRALEGNP